MSISLTLSSNVVVRCNTLVPIAYADEREQVCPGSESARSSRWFPAVCVRETTHRKDQVPLSHPARIKPTSKTISLPALFFSGTKSKTPRSQPKTHGGQEDGVLEVELGKDVLVVQDDRDRACLTRSTWRWVSEFRTIDVDVPPGTERGDG